MARVRRYIEQALDNDYQAAEYIMQLFGELYELELELKEDDIIGTDIKILRNEKAVQVLDRLQRFMKEKITSAISKSPIWKAIAYALPRWRSPACTRNTQN